MKPGSTVFLRHGETTFHAERRYQGASDDSELSAKGVEQTIELRECIRELNVHRCYCSPIKRAQQTLDLVRECMPGAHIVGEPALREVRIPAWEGRLKSEIEAVDPSLIHLWRTRPDLFFDDHGERPLLELYGRVRSFIDAMVVASGDRLIIGHDHVNRAAISSLIGLPIEAHSRIPQAASSISIVADAHEADRPALQVSNLEHVHGRAKPFSFDSKQPRILLVRHGVTDANVGRVYQGSENRSLSDLGCDQIAGLEELLSNVAPKAVISSALLRAKESAELLPFASDVARIEDARLNEFFYGRWQGCSDSDVDRRFPEDKAAWRLMIGDRPIPDGESLTSLVARVSAALTDIWRRVSAGGTVVVVAHDVVIRTIVALSLRLHRKAIWAFPISNAGVTELVETRHGDIILAKHNVLAGRLEDRYGRQYL